MRPTCVLELRAFARLLSRSPDAPPREFAASGALSGCAHAAQAGDTRGLQPVQGLHSRSGDVTGSRPTAGKTKGRRFSRWCVADAPTQLSHVPSWPTATHCRKPPRGLGRDRGEGGGEGRGACCDAAWTRSPGDGGGRGVQLLGGGAAPSIVHRADAERMVPSRVLLQSRAALPPRSPAATTTNVLQDRVPHLLKGYLGWMRRPHRGRPPRRAHPGALCRMAHRQVPWPFRRRVRPQVQQAPQRQGRRRALTCDWLWQPMQLARSSNRPRTRRNECAADKCWNAMHGALCVAERALRVCRQ